MLLHDLHKLYMSYSYIGLGKDQHAILISCFRHALLTLESKVGINLSTGPAADNNGWYTIAVNNHELNWLIYMLQAQQWMC